MNYEDDIWNEWWNSDRLKNEDGDPILVDEPKIWNEFAGCLDPLPTIDDCKQMRDAGFCPYLSCAEYPCWE